MEWPILNVTISSNLDYFDQIEPVKMCIFAFALILTWIFSMMLVRDKNSKTGFWKRWNIFPPLYRLYCVLIYNLTFTWSQVKKRHLLADDGPTLSRRNCQAKN